MRDCGSLGWPLLQTLLVAGASIHECFQSTEIPTGPPRLGLGEASSPVGSAHSWPRAKRSTTFVSRTITPLEANV